MAKRRRKPSFGSKEKKRKYEAYKHMHVCKGGRKR